MIFFIGKKNVEKPIAKQAVTDLKLGLIHDATYRQRLIKAWKQNQVRNCLDGISFDVEAPMFTYELKDSYAKLIEETAAEFRNMSLGKW